MNVALSMYKGADGFDVNSLLFKSEWQKERIQMWLNYLIAGINLLITCAVLYLAMIRINEVSSDADFIFLPIFGFAVMMVTLIGLFSAIIKKS